MFIRMNAPVEKLFSIAGMILKIPSQIHYNTDIGRYLIYYYNELHISVVRIINKLANSADS